MHALVPVQRPTFGEGLFESLRMVTQQSPRGQVVQSEPRVTQKKTGPVVKKRVCAKANTREGLSHKEVVSSRHQLVTKSQCFAHGHGGRHRTHGAKSRAVTQRYPESRAASRILRDSRVEHNDYQLQDALRKVLLELRQVSDGDLLLWSHLDGDDKSMTMMKMTHSDMVPNTVRSLALRTWSDGVMTSAQKKKIELSRSSLPHNHHRPFVQ